MIDHHLQRDIIRRLVASPAAHFTELKPEGIESNIFTYHLQQLLKQNYVEKQTDGTYALTATGKALGVNINVPSKEVLRQAHPVLFLALKTAEKGWLLRRRTVQPMHGKVGFVHGEPNADELIATTATVRFKEVTGLSASFTPRGSGYVRIFKDGELESFTAFTLLFASTATGDLMESTPSGSNLWQHGPNLSDPDMLPSMAALVTKLEQPDYFFTDLEFHL